VFADFKSRTPSLPILLAAQMDEPLRRRIKDLWAFGSMADERVRELGTAVLATDAPRAALTLMDREIDAALDALGPLRDSPGANELTDWARRLGAAFR
jgi:geranylgeranyl pyrophosphate synthase